MYDHIQGEVTDVVAARVVLRAAGVGYELKVPTGVSASLKRGPVALLYTILHVTDGNPTLLGFSSREDREFARMIAFMLERGARLPEEAHGNGA